LNSADEPRASVLDRLGPLLKLRRLTPVIEKSLVLGLLDGKGLNLALDLRPLTVPDLFEQPGDSFELVSLAHDG